MASKKGRKPAKAKRRASIKPKALQGKRIAVKAKPARSKTAGQRPAASAVSIFDRDLPKNPANYAAMTPTTFLARTVEVYPNRIAVIHGDRKYTYAEFYARCRRLASALRKHGIGRNVTVSVMASNVPAKMEAHFGVLMAGGVINPLNYRLDADIIAFILNHGECKALITDREYSPTIKAALAKLGRKILVIDIDDPLYTGPGERLGKFEYEDFLTLGDPEFDWQPPADEWDAMALSYTSGTTGDPKGVVYHHRGTYINALANIAVWPMPKHPVYLWTLPMFHALGWCFPWSVIIMAGTHVCLRKVEGKAIFDAIAEHKVTHFCGAPIVLSTIINTPQADKKSFGHKVSCFTAASAPPPSTLKAMQELRFDVTHVYGLTEVFGPNAICAWHEEWDALPIEEQARIKARQGVAYPTLEGGADVFDPKTMKPVARDSATMGEIVMRGNTIMKGYLKNPKSTQAAFAGGWFHTGDLAVMHPDGYFEIKDRSKDIIISGGENISSIEVESALYSHPDIIEAAVVAKHDDKWGEIPVAFVNTRPGAAPLTEQDIIAYCRGRLAHYKCPKRVIFAVLPKTSTGKIQKFLLRDQVKDA
ncbi:MAG: acyl-CoA synthetase [Alphaproteobacteria bacterium]